MINDRLAPHGQGHSALRKWAKNEVFSHWNYKVISPELGEIVVDENSARDTFAHGLSPFKIEAVRAIKDVIEQGVVFTQTKIEDNDHYFIAAPVTIENQVDIVSVLVRKDMNTQRMYLHSVMVREKILEKDFEQKNTPEHTFPKADSRELSEQNRKLYSGDIGRILQNYLKVNIRELEVEINQQIEQQKGNKMAQANDNTTEQQISRQELDNRLLSWSSQYIDALNNVIVAEQNSATLDERTNLVNAFYENKKQNPLLVAPDDILTATEKELKNEHLYGVQTIFSNTMDKLVEQVQQQLQQKTVATYSQDNPYAAYAKDDETAQKNADDWEMREPLTSEKLSHFNELAQKQGFTTYVENHHADTGIFQADKEIDETYRIEITGQFKNHGSQDAFESARDFTMTFHQGDEIVHYFYTNQLDKTLEQAAEFSKNPAQWIENKDKTVEQHLSDLVDETVAIMQKHSVIEQGQPEKIPAQEVFSGNLKDKVKEVHQELAVESLEFQFTHKGLADRSAAFNQELLQLNPEQLKELQPYFEQHKAIQTLQGLYKQTGDTERLTEMQEHNRLLEWKIHNKVEAYLGKHIDEQKQSSVDEPKNFVQNQTNNNETPKNLSDNSISDSKNSIKSTQDLTSKLSNPAVFQKEVMFNAIDETIISKMIDDIAKERTYLAVDFDNKDAAKAAGAKYDPQAKGWYAVEVTPELRQFLPQQPENITAERRPMSDFIATAQKIGLDLNNSNFKEEFGRWIRVPLKGKGARNTDGGYKLYRNDDGSIGGCVKNYSTNDTSTWNDRIQDGKQIQSKVPLPDYLANQRQKEWNTIAQHTAQSNVAAMRGEVATKAYHALQPALPDDPYIKNKGISDLSKLKRLDDGSTIVPLYNNGKLANLQMIPSYDSSQKRMMTQAAKVGAYYSIGNTKTPSVVIVAEGVATADSVHQIATEIYGKDSVLTLSAIDSGNLPNVAAKVQHNFPAAQKIVAADNDAHNATRAELKFKNAGLDKANEVKQAYPDFQVALCPALTDEKGSVKNTDWNDFLKAQGKATSVKAFANNEQYIQQYSVKQPAATPQMTAQKIQQNNQGRSL